MASRLMFFTLIEPEESLKLALASRVSSSKVVGISGVSATQA